MTNDADKDKSTQSPKMPAPKGGDDDLIMTPVNIARARYASAHSPSIVDKTRRVMAIKTGRQTASAETATKGAESVLFGGANGCVVVSILGTVFVVGGILGGIAGGSMVMWAGNGNAAAMQLETPTLIPTPTPKPVETMTPTPTPTPGITPVTEDILAQVMQSVVTVINQQNHAFALNPADDRVLGSGVIIDARGYIATNHHVVENANGLSVVLADGRQMVAQLVVSDPAQDLAIIKISVDNLTPIKWGDSTTARPGQMVYAIGSPLGDFPNSVSLGIISGLNRALEMNDHVIDGLLQTDAAVNRGSSGGPLVNSQGEMIGINTFIIRESKDRGIAEGIAFAIPTEKAKNILFPWIAAHSGQAAPIPASGQ